MSIIDNKLAAGYLSCFPFGLKYQFLQGKCFKFITIFTYKTETRLECGRSWDLRNKEYGV